MSHDQVAYRAVGQLRPIMEAAASRGFPSVPGPVLDALLCDIHVRGSTRVAHRMKIQTLLKAYQSEWKWSDIDVARAMAKALWPTPRRTIPQKEETVWSDIESIVNAMRPDDSAKQVIGSLQDLNATAAQAGQQNPVVTALSLLNTEGSGC